MNTAKQWWKALVSWWERQRPFRRSGVDLWHPERQVMPNAVAEPHRPNKRAVTGDHGAVETSDDVSYKFAGTTDTMPDGSLPEGADSIDWYRLQPPPNPIAERRARAEELLTKLQGGK
jgi:hypothetical protein